MHEKYQPQVVEEKWQANWAANQTFRVEADPTREKFYALEMLPYPSGKIHIGHVRNYSIGDAYAWYKRLRGFNVLHPMGWDAFGMPAENAAIKNNARPDDWTLSNIAAMRAQLQRMGFSYDWSREVASCTPEYYRWNQWIFIQLFKKGLLYRKKAVVNWCPDCNTSLANEQAEGGFCWRHATTPVEQRELEQWFVKMTNYCEELLAGINGELRDGWVGHVLKRQQDWIGRSDGAFVDFEVAGSPEVKIRVFTTRIDTIFGANAIIIAPEHPILKTLLSDAPNRKDVEAFAEKLAAMTQRERTESKEKEGVPTGLFAVNPFNGEELPIWTANFVLANYGTGALMSVPAHDERDYEFSRKYKLPIRRVIFGDIEDDGNSTLKFNELPYLEYGMLGPHCGDYTGMTSEKARQALAEAAKEKGFGESNVVYRIRDWGISRQRAWGTPIPMIHCAACGTISPEKEENLPVELPKDLDFSIGAPLANHAGFHAGVVCPACGADARRDTDTMDTFVDSNWYYFRYTDPKNTDLPFDPEVVKYWMPVDFYIGGDEHAVMHLIYTRAWSMMMRDIGLNHFGEPVKRLMTQGMVILNGAKMSKSLGNVVDPDEMIQRYGADATRLSILFAAPVDREVDWKQVKDENGYTEYPAAEGALRFLARVWRLAHKWRERCLTVGDSQPVEFSEVQAAARRGTHRGLKRTTEAFEDGLRLNVAVAACMETTNALYEFDGTISGEGSATDAFVMREGLTALTLMLAPLTPHIAEELWAELGHAESVSKANWIPFDEKLAADAQLEIPVQVNGKLRGKLLVAPDIAEEDLKTAAFADEKVKPFTDGKDVVKVIVVPKRLVNIVVK